LNTNKQKPITVRCRIAPVKRSCRAGVVCRLNKCLTIAIQE
jgi:hypothetical protein